MCVFSRQPITFFCAHLTLLPVLFVCVFLARGKKICTNAFGICVCADMVVRKYVRKFAWACVCVCGVCVCVCVCVLV